MTDEEAAVVEDGTEFGDGVCDVLVEEADVV